MALANYKAEKREHQAGGEKFTVQGLSLAPITQLIQLHLSDIEALWKLGAEVLDGATEIDDAVLATLAGALANEAPGLVANAIALASGEEATPEVIEAAAHLPLGVQVAAMYDILELTFTEIGGIKKAVALFKLKTAGMPMFQKMMRTARS